MIETKDLVEFMKHREDEHSEKLYTEDRYREYCREIVAILKNQPTITKKDIECWACEAWDRVGDSLGYAEEHIEDVMKDMLTEMGVIITLNKEEK